MDNEEKRNERKTGKKKEKKGKRREKGKCCGPMETDWSRIEMSVSLSLIM